MHMQPIYRTDWDTVWTSVKTFFVNTWNSIKTFFTNNRNVTINGLSVNVNGYETKNDNDLADTIVHRINDMLNEDGSVWGK